MNRERVLIMEKLEKVELVREKCNVSYEEAREALEACNYDVLDAIVMLEKAHEPTERMASDIPPAPEAAYELPGAAQATSGNEGAGKGTSRFAATWKRFCMRCKELFGAGMDTMFVAERGDEIMFEIPVLVVVIGLLVWGASLWMLIIGLFFGLRYRIEGKGKVTDGVNEVMDKAADAATEIKQSIA
jgi:hypothetical protein